jgi:hypothetical protein
MGIFGFLSKAHLDQTIPTGDVAAQVSLIDEKIQNERNTIEDARRLLKQLDDAVIGIQSGEGREIRNRDGTTRIENPAERALQVRRAQANDRTTLTKTIEDAQTRIVALQEQKAPIAGQLREVEAKVGPIKYIAALIYGETSDHSNLESAVRWVIIIIVLVFDPLAVVLLLASQYSFQWFRQEKEELATVSASEVAPKEPEPEPVQLPQEPDIVSEANEKLAEIEREVDIEAVMSSVEESQQQERTALENWNAMIEEAEKAAIDEAAIEDTALIDSAEDSEKNAMRLWKAAHPEDNLKHQRKLFDSGIILELPWMVPPYMASEITADNIDDTVDTESSSGTSLKLSDLKKKSATYIEKIGKSQIVKPINDQ